MITKIEIKNINAIKRAEIKFDKFKYKYHQEMIMNNEFVNPIAFYGTNGSGKSSFLTAVSQFVDLLTDEPDSLSIFTPNYSNIEEDSTTSIEPLDEKSYVKIYFRLVKVDYSYKIETSIKNVITSEVLIKDKKEIFSRSVKQYKYNGETLKVDSPMFPLLRKLEIEKNDEVVRKCFSFLSNIAFIDASKRYFNFKASKQKGYKDIIVDRSKEVKSILAKYKEFPLYDVFSLPSKMGKQKDYYIAIKTDGGNLVLPFDLASTGMTNTSMLLSTLLSIPDNGVLLVDEIEDALHPLTVLDFINVAIEKNIQLIFSSHNTYILQKLRPDQIFFAHWRNGSSKYKRLSEIYPNIREINNIEKMYLSNLFDEDIKKDE